VIAAPPVRWQEGNDAIAQVSVVLLQADGLAVGGARLARAARTGYGIDGKGSSGMRDRGIRAVAARIVCALALIMLGFADPAFATSDGGGLAAQYRLPDGSYPSLCKTGSDAGRLPHNVRHCDLCFAAGGHAFVPPHVVFVGFCAEADRNLVQSISAIGLERGARGHGLCRGPPSVA